MATPPLHFHSHFAARLSPPCHRENHLHTACTHTHTPPPHTAMLLHTPSTSTTPTPLHCHSQHPACLSPLHCHLFQENGRRHTPPGRQAGRCPHLSLDIPTSLTAPDSNSFYLPYPTHTPPHTPHFIETAPHCSSRYHSHLILTLLFSPLVGGFLTSPVFVWRTGDAGCSLASLFIHATAAFGMAAETPVPARFASVHCALCACSAAHHLPSPAASCDWCAVVQTPARRFIPHARRWPLTWPFTRAAPLQDG